MNGHGSPPLTGRCGRRSYRQLLWLLAIWFCALPFSSVLAEPTSVRVRFEWSDPEPRIWMGYVEMEGGQFSDFRVLGLDADQPGAYVLEHQRVRVWPRFATQRSGFETLVSGELDDVIRLRLRPESNSTVTESVDVTLRELLQQDVTRTGVVEGHRLTIRRAPGDKIRVGFPQNHMIFSPWRASSS